VIGARGLRLLRSYLTRGPIWCSVQVTPRCESYCAFCEHRAEAAESEIAVSEFERISTELSRIGSLVVSLSGGDPFLRSDLPEIVAAFARHHYTLATTNGWLVTAERARAVWAAGLRSATVVMESADAARQDAVTGLPGSHRRAEEAVSFLARERSRPWQQVNVKLRLTPDGLSEVEPLAELASRHGATMTVEPSYPVARARSKSGAAEALAAAKRRHRSLVSAPSYLVRFDEALDGGVPGCQAGRAFFNVDHRGRVSKCIEFQRPNDLAGDLTSEAAGIVLSRLRRESEANACRSCWHSSRGEIEGLYTVRGLLDRLPGLVKP
jgi:MoaA/NifB/PqqE/SkfB family radical SAM enzyme